MLTRSLLASFALVFTACVNTQTLPSELPPLGSMTSQMVGPAGGTLVLGDLRVVVPHGALASDTMITVHVADAGNAPFTAYSPLLTFEPANLTLMAPVEVHLPFRGDATLATGFAAGGASAAFAPQITNVSGDVATVNLRQLSSTFVGTACTGASCTCDAVGQLDLVVVVDDSHSMAAEQALLAGQLPALFRALATGDLDGNGTQDVAAFDDVRVGITTTDLGLGSVAGVPACNTGLGDDGALHTSAATTDPRSASCPTMPYPQPFAGYDATMPSGLDGFLAQLDCLSAVGSQGCGLEQQLEAGLLAISPSAATPYTAPGWVAPVFPDGRVGQAEMANRGFLREGSILALVFLTDEDDGSARDSALYSPDDPRFNGVSLNVRGIAYPDQLMPVDEFVRGFTSVRVHPSDVVVGAIAGIPQNVATTDLGALLARPDMTVQIDQANPTEAVSVCSSANGTAWPARRIVETLQGVEAAGGQAVVQSICDSSFAAFTDALAHALARRAGGAC